MLFHIAFESRLFDVGILIYIEQMELTDTFKEDIVSNLLLGAGLVLYFAARDLCKRISHSDCRYDGDRGLIFALPTWHGDQEDTDAIV